MTQISVVHCCQLLAIVAVTPILGFRHCSRLEVEVNFWLAIELCNFKGGHITSVQLRIRIEISECYTVYVVHLAVILIQRLGDF